MLVLVRRRKLTQVQRRIALGALGQLAVELDHEAASLSFNRLSDLASTHHLSIYDAAYLEVAMRLKLPLACTDGPLRAAAKRCRVRLAA